MIAVIDGCGTNITSVMFALERLNAQAALTSKPEFIRSADHVILPGVGAARTAMDSLHTAELVQCINSLSQPVLGICLGMQLLFSRSEEGPVDMLDIVPGLVRHFTPTEARTIPHMGWNSVEIRSEHPLLEGLENGSFFYFVHSYFGYSPEYTIGSCDYGDRFTAIVAKDNFMGCQFHPERSGQMGARILKNFVEMN